jgi:hypothetical protein
MDDNAKLAACLQFLRRSHYTAGVYDVAAIRTASAAAFAEGTEQVTITSTSSELGAAGGQVTFDKWILIAAYEQLLLEVDPANTPAPPPSGWIPDFSGRYVET